MKNYAQAKANIVRFQQARDTAVLCADDPGAMALASLVKGRLRTFSAQQVVQDGAFVQEKQIWLADGAGKHTAVCALSDIQLRGAHNVLNVLAATTLADSAGLPHTAVSAAIKAFTGVEHRLEPVCLVNEVQYINDSIATAPERALAALAAFEREPLILLAGGRDKNMVWNTWAATVAQRVKHVILFGDLAPLLADHLRRAGRTAEVTTALSLEDAVTISAKLAQPGDVVLLSPGGTSFDAFPDFAARGERFRQLAREMRG
jgi:UDP-N-acetylmuramoylalanine--D-glutamate ligase